MELKNKKNVIYICMFAVWAVFFTLAFIDYFKNTPHHPAIFYVLGAILFLLVVLDIVLVIRKVNSKLSSKGSICGTVISLCLWGSNFYFAYGASNSTFLHGNFIGLIISFYLFVGMCLPFWKLIHFFPDK